MAFAIYTAKRGLVSYHTIDTDYTISFDLSVAQRPSGGDLKQVQRSLSGVQITNFFGEDRVWSVQTAPVQIGTPAEQLLVEFLRSTADGQSFTFSPYGDVGADPGFPVERSDDGYTEEVFQVVDGVLDYVRFGFRLKEV
jgi:hypothetical protein